MVKSAVISSDAKHAHPKLQAITIQIKNVVPDVVNPKNEGGSDKRKMRRLGSVCMHPTDTEASRRCRRRGECFIKWGFIWRRHRRRRQRRHRRISEPVPPRRWGGCYHAFASIFCWRFCVREIGSEGVVFPFLFIEFLFFNQIFSRIFAQTRCFLSANFEVAPRWGRGKT